MDKGEKESESGEGDNGLEASVYTLTHKNCAGEVERAGVKKCIEWGGGCVMRRQTYSDRG